MKLEQVVAPGIGGLPRLVLQAPDGARSEIYLHGAHVTSWVPAGGQERLYVSELAEFRPDAAIRGGIPAESFVFVRCHNEGVIDLAGGDVEDFLETSGGGGHIINGGTVKSNGHVWVSQLEENTFSGTAEFKQVDEAFDGIETLYGVGYRFKEQ